MQHLIIFMLYFSFLRDLEEKLQRATQELHAVSEERNEAEHRMRKERRTLDEGAHKAERIEFELKALERKVKDLKDQIARQEGAVAKAKPDKKELKAKQGKIEELEGAHREAEEEASGIELEVKKINGKIKEVMGSKVKGISKRLEETKGKLDKLKAEMTRLEVEIKTSTRTVDKCRDKVEAYEAEVKDCEEKMYEMRDKRKQLEVDGAKAIEELESLKKGERERLKRGEELAAEVEEKKKAEAKVKSQQLEINQVREKFDMEIKEQTKTRSHWRREVRRLKLRSVPGEEAPEELPESYPQEELRQLDTKKWQYELNLKEERLSSLKVNFSAIEEYRKKEDLYLERVSELEDISRKKEKQRKNHEDLRKMRLNEFMEGFSIITGKLKEMYQMITLGGDAELELVDSLDPFAEGIVFR